MHRINRNVIILTEKNKTMSEAVSLIKDNPLLPAEDYAAMRRQGFKAIEKLGSKIWTDYNNSDPGITILEAVAYAITDLAYRTGFEVKDLLTPENLTDDTWKQVFYTARQILHNSALTITDYRKMMVDIKGVRNAWIEPSREYEVPMWINYNYFEKRKDTDCGCEDNALKTCFGKTMLDEVTPADAAAFKTTKQTETREKIAKLIIEKGQVEKAIAEIKTQLENETDPFAIMELKASLKTKEMRLSKMDGKLAGLQNDLNTIRDMPAFVPSKIIELEGLYNVMVEYEEDVLEEDRREEVRQQVVQKLSKHRNLCEDFLTVNAVEYIDFGLGASIALEEYADSDVVLAEIFFIIYKYFTPSIPFNTINQMLAKGYDIDEIFEGPALRHGFIENSAIENTDLFRDIRLSDIISEVMDIKGVKAITKLHLPFTDFTDPANANQHFNDWVKFLQNERKVARIVPAMSQVIFCKQRDLVTYNTGSSTDRQPGRMLKLFKDLKTAERKYKLEDIPLDLPLPIGENMTLEDYYPVTHSLPMCYGVSERAGLPGDANEKRKVQALQLRGYMLFFEQLILNHQVQLNHLRDIYTMDDSVSKTYYTKPLAEFSGEHEMHSQKKLLDGLLIDFGNHGSVHFEKVLKDFAHVLQHIVEPPALFHERRNRFLNHFLARFSEDMSEYEAICRWLVPDKVDQRLVKDKTAILKNGEYYKISTNRGKGYDYTRPEFWNTTNVSGLERRAGRLLGFSNVQRHTLAPTFIFAEAVMELNAKKLPEQKKNKKNQPLSVIKITDPDNAADILLTSVEVTDGCCVELLMSEIIAHADDRRNFKFHDQLNQRARKTAGPIGDFWFELWDGYDMGTAVLLGKSNHFERREMRDKAWKELQAAIKRINDNEGMHLIEHTLLRPKLDEVLDEANVKIPVSFLNVCLDKCDIGIGLGEGTEEPAYRKKISRLPAEKCYDKMPWVLQYMRYNKSTEKYDQSLLFQQTFPSGADPVLLKFRQYTAMAQRVRDLQEYGSERINYTIVSNEATEAGKLKYSFIIKGDEGEVLAQSLFAFNKRTPGKPVPADDIEDEIAALMEWLGNEMDWYCNANPCDNNEDAYSFRATVVLPCWPKRLRDGTFRNLVEKTIHAQAPAHVALNIVWLGIPEMIRFEKAYCDWLEEMSLTEMPAYDKVNPLVEVINTLKPCGVCEDDCGGKEKEPEAIKEAQAIRKLPE
jgi:hypothetical protein